MNEQFQLVPHQPNESPEAKIRVMRTNSLGSLFWFIKHALRRKRLTTSLHLPICRSLEREHIKDVLEMPRDHFKSTICSEGLPMWWALPFTSADEAEFKLLGYSEEFLRFMRHVHDPETRTLLVSENITNAAKLGSKIRWHFESNAIYRSLFPETLPSTKEVWTNFSLHVRSAAGGSHGEGTFDFLGVGGALQSRHYKRAVQDDLVGRKAIESQSIMDKTIEYHQLLVGAFESEDANHENSELVVGNRWSYFDLNSHIREKEPWFPIHSHSALGGCCGLHPTDTPIFPEEFSHSKLAGIRRRLGAYNFSCQFLNNPCAPEDADFKLEWLQYFTPTISKDFRDIIVHKVNGYGVRKDLYRRSLAIVMITDPAHSEGISKDRCRHAIDIIGMSEDENFYLLDYWAKQASYDTYIAELFKMADKWKLNQVGVETIAAQRYLAYHIKYRSRMEGRTLRIIELKGEVEGPDGAITTRKEWRIRNILQPIFEEGRFWIKMMPDGSVPQQDFLGEYQTFPKGKFCDILDALAYAPQVLRKSMTSGAYDSWRRANDSRQRLVNQSYSVAVN